MQLTNQALHDLNPLLAVVDNFAHGKFSFHSNFYDILSKNYDNFCDLCHIFDKKAGGQMCLTGRPRDLETAGLQNLLTQSVPKFGDFDSEKYA
jgi:hypothetical protein